MIEQYVSLLKKRQLRILATCVVLALCVGACSTANEDRSAQENQDRLGTAKVKTKMVGTAKNAALALNHPITRLLCRNVPVRTLRTASAILVSLFALKRLPILSHSGYYLKGKQF